MRIFRTLLATFVLAHSSPWVVDAADTTSPSPKPGAAQPVQIIGLDNAFRVSDNIYSGSQPETDATFAALAKLGVKTIVSVDGSKPDVERAHRYGLHYVHVPFGYGGIPTNRVAELVKAVATKPGPFYVHCHHGMHRGPAAVAVICENNGTWSPSQAVAWLHQAGTSQEYPGLFRAASEFRKPTDAELAAVKSLPETAASTSLVDAMVAVDEHFSWLKACQKAGWSPPSGHPDISPGHEALMLWEQLKELPRVTDLAARGDDFREKLNEAERAADALRALLQAKAGTAALDGAFKRSAQSCAACHKQYRN